MTPKEILDYFTAKSKETEHPISFVDLAHWTHALMQQQANTLAACQQELEQTKDNEKQALENLFRLQAQRTKEQGILIACQQERDALKLRLESVEGFIG